MTNEENESSATKASNPLTPQQDNRIFELMPVRSAPWNKQQDVHDDADMVSREAVNKILYEGYQRHLHECTNSVRAAEFIHGLQKAVTALRPADTEQLVRLREAAGSALSLKWLRDLCLNHREGCGAITLYDNECSCGLKDYLATDAALRNALGTQEEEYGNADD